MVTATKKDQGLQDFGAKLGGARKDRVLSAERVISDDKIGNMTLSEIWPKSEVDDIENIDMAALATAIRSEIPAKPRMKYKLDRWVESVKLMRWFMKYTNEHGFEPTMQVIKEKGQGKLDPLIYKVNTLRQLPREHWSRIEDVNYYPDAHTFDDNHKPVPKPYAGGRVDGRYITAPSLEGLINVMRERLNVEKPQATIKFEIRGYKDNYSINKKGDPLYRKLKTFTGENALKEARAYMEQSKPDLLKAWEGIKEAENVKETDVRNAENRPRVGKNYRQGRDATPEMFLDAFGFRGVEFGNWVSQGVNTKERQGMLNAAYDALMDLAAIMGVSPRWLSLNGALGLGLGSRGSGKASAHYEPGTVVINLTKTRGAGTLAHEWFHAVDNYFQKKRGTSIGDKKSQHSIIDSPGDYYVHKPTLQKVRATRFVELKEQNRINKPEEWEFVGNLPAELSTSFERLRKALDDSPMAKRSSRIDKGQSGYWSRPHERAARAFENYVIAKMISGGYHNDYLANVVKVEGFKRDPDNYPYLLDNEIEPISKEFDSLIHAIKKHEPKSTEPYEAKVTKKEEAPMAKTNIDKDEEDYYAEFADDRGEKHKEEYKDIQEPAAPAVVKAELKESVKEGKAIDKSAAAVVKEAEKIIEQPKQKESVKAAITQAKGMEYQDRATYLEVVERRLEEVDRMAAEMSEEAQGITEWLRDDPVANYKQKGATRKKLDKEASKLEGKPVFKQSDIHYDLTHLLSKTGEWPDTLTKKQANLLLMGGEIKPSVVNAKGRVPWAYVVDHLADHFKMGEQEFINHIENLASQKSRLDDMGGLIKEAEDRKKELEEIREAIQKYNNEQRHVSIPEEPKVKQEIGQPEAGLQKGMFGHDKEVRPEGKGKVTQINLLEHGRLQEIRAKVAKSEDIHGDLMAEVRKIQEDRTPRAVAADNAQTAKNVVKGPDVKKWLKHPEHFDIRNVDTKRARRPRQRGSSGARVRVSR